MAKLTAISGVGAKGPACFLIDTGRARLMLDLGYGPAPDQWPDLSRVGGVDALLLSHSHRDHAGALERAAQIGNPPIHATGSVLARLGKTGTALPLQGEAGICGVRVRTGRNGHAPGGVWLHLDIGDGLLYTGDYSVESPVYVLDMPPAAATLVLDGSYGDYSESLEDCVGRFGEVLERGSALFPVPADGRGPEMAYRFARARGVPPCLGKDLRASLERLATRESDSLRSGVAAELQRIAREAPPITVPRGLLLAGRADAAGGEVADLVARWEAELAPDIIFSGYVPPGTPAQRLVDSGRARYIRWNVHPRLGDNASLVRAVKARTVVPAFGDARHLNAWRAAFAPAHVTLEREVAL